MEDGTTLYHMFVADVMTILELADVIAIVADGIATYIYMCGLVFLPNITDGTATCDS